MTLVQKECLAKCKIRLTPISFHEEKPILPILIAECGVKQQFTIGTRIELEMILFVKIILVFMEVKDNKRRYCNIENLRENGKSKKICKHFGMSQAGDRSKCDKKEWMIEKMGNERLILKGIL